VVTGDVNLYARRFGASMLAMAVTFTPDSPPPVPLPLPAGQYRTVTILEIVLTDVQLNLVVMTRQHVSASVTTRPSLDAPPAACPFAAAGWAWPSRSGHRLRRGLKWPARRSSANIMAYAHGSRWSGPACRRSETTPGPSLRCGAESCLMVLPAARVCCH
jgi:hypothetical protein